MLEQLQLDGTDELRGAQQARVRVRIAARLEQVDADAEAAALWRGGRRQAFEAEPLVQRSVANDEQLAARHDRDGAALVQRR